RLSWIFRCAERGPSKPILQMDRRERRHLRAPRRGWGRLHRVREGKHLELLDSQPGCWNGGTARIREPGEGGRLWSGMDWPERPEKRVARCCRGLPKVSMKFEWLKL